MKRTILSLLIVGLSAGYGASAMAQNVTAGEQPGATAPKKQVTPEGDAAKAPSSRSTNDPKTPAGSAAAGKPGKTADEANSPSTARTKKAVPEGDAANNTPGMNADETKAPATNAAADQPAMTGDEKNTPNSDAASAAVWKAEYKAATDKAQSVFNEAKAKCDTLQDTGKSDCMKNATAARKESLAQAKAELDSHTKMNGRPEQPTKGDLDRPAIDARNTQ